MKREKDITFLTRIFFLKMETRNYYSLMCYSYKSSADTTSVCVIKASKKGETKVTKHEG